MTLKALLVLGTAVVLFGAGCTLEPEGEGYAIVYGISEYYYFDDHPWDDDPDHDADLSYCHLDALDMAALLGAKGFDVTLRSDDPEAVSMPGSPPEVTPTNLAADIAEVAGKIGPNDLFLFFFSGHGSYFTAAGDEPPISDVNDELLVLNLDDGRYFLSDDELAGLIGQIPCTRKVVILDACFTGGMIGNELEYDGIPPDRDEPLSQPNGLLESVFYLYTNFGDWHADISPYDALVISAAGEAESSYDGHPAYIPGVANGVFTHFLLEAAELGDLNGDGRLTVSEAYAYTRGAIEKNWNAAAPPSWAFSPHVSGGPVDLVLFETP